jgi:hypothetical protein
MRLVEWHCLIGHKRSHFSDMCNYTLTPSSYTVYIDNNLHTYNSDVILVVLPEISEQLLFPIDINIYTLICLSSGGKQIGRNCAL